MNNIDAGKKKSLIFDIRLNIFDKDCQYNVAILQIQKNDILKRFNIQKILPK